jgi:transposase-like protein/uncharacterized protein (DUF433 family)
MGKLTEQQHQEVCDAFVAKETIAEIARRFGITESSVWKFLTRRGLHSPRPQTNVSDDERQRIVRSYQSGDSVKEIARRFTRSMRTVATVLGREKVLLSKADGKLRRIPDNVRDRVAVLYQGGMTADEITALDLHPKITKRVIFHELRRRGIETRRTGSRGRFHGQAGAQKEIVDLYQKGWSRSWLADSFECSRDAVERVLRSAGVELRSFDEQTGLKWTDKLGRTFHMRSMWEIKTACWLDNNDRRWDYEKHSYDIGDGRTYTPDFWVYGSTIELVQLIDVKGWLRPESKAAIGAFKLAYPELPFELLDETALRSHGILDIKIPGDIEPGPSYPVCVNMVTVEEKDEIARFYQSGLTIKETAAKTNRSHTIVEQVIAERGLARNKATSKRMRTPQAVRDQIAALYLAGDSINTVAEKVGLGRDLVWGEVRRRGISRSRKRRVPSE